MSLLTLQSRGARMPLLTAAALLGCTAMFVQSSKQTEASLRLLLVPCCCPFVASCSALQVRHNALYHFGFNDVSTVACTCTLIAFNSNGSICKPDLILQTSIQIPDMTSSILHSSFLFPGPFLSTLRRKGRTRQHCETCS